MALEFRVSAQGTSLKHMFRMKSCFVRIVTFLTVCSGLHETANKGEYIGKLRLRVNVKR